MPRKRARKTRIIANPAAGRGGELETLEAWVRERPDAGLAVTSSPGEAARLAAQSLAGGWELVAAAGGDGTLHEVVNGLAPETGRLPLGILPIGTGNDFARALGIPEDLEGALAVLERGREREVDLVRVRSAGGERLLVNASSGGFAGQVDENLDPETKRTWGSLAYLRSAAEVLPEITEFDLRVVCDGTEALETPALNLVVANGKFVAAGIPIAPDAEVDDGLLDLIVIPPLNGGGLALLAARVLAGSHLEHEDVLFRRARRLHVRCDPAIWINVDGELAEEDELTYEVLPRALRVVCPGR